MFESSRPDQRNEWNRPIFGLAFFICGVLDPQGFPLLPGRRMQQEILI